MENGYKQVEFGLIPNDWNEVTLNDCLELLTDFEANGSFEDVAKHVSIFDNENYAWYVRATDLENNSVLSKVKYVDTSTYKFLAKTRLFGGEVLITKRGEIGKVYFFNMRTEYATVAPNMYLLKLNENVVPFYIFSFFKSVGNRLLIEKNASTTLGALYKNDVKAIKIPLPPTKAEQTAIATALNDADALITQLEKLIAKKRAIKQGAMQELLRPKEGWEVKKLGEVADHFKESIIPINFPSAQFSHFSLPAFDEGGMPTFESGVKILSNKFKVPKDAILVAKLNPRIPRVWMPKIVPENAIASTEFLVLMAKKFVTREYLYTFCKSSYFFKQMELSVTGTTGSHQRINPNDAMQIEVCFPSSVENQTLIATILSNMGSEITTLETKLAKTKSIKQGMMQQLLTGKIRLI